MQHPKARRSEIVEMAVKLNCRSSSEPLTYNFICLHNKVLVRLAFGLFLLKCWTLTRGCSSKGSRSCPDSCSVTRIAIRLGSHPSLLNFIITALLWYVHWRILSISPTPGHTGSSSPRKSHSRTCPNRMLRYPWSFCNLMQCRTYPRTR